MSQAVFDVSIRPDLLFFSVLATHFEREVGLLSVSKGEQLGG